MPKLKGIVFLMLLAGITNDYAQQRVTDSALYAIASANTTNYFIKAIGTQSGLYNGAEYYFYSRDKQDNVFFEDQTFFSPSTVNYDGTIYTNVPLMYDILLNQVVSQLYDNYSSYILHNEKITDFTYLGHHFVYRVTDSLNSNGLQTGIYDQIYAGPSEALVSRSKKIITLAKQQNTYPETDNIYVKSGGIYYETGSQHKLLTLLKSRKKELRKFINDNNLNFTTDIEAAVVKVLAQYDKLNQ